MDGELPLVDMKGAISADGHLQCGVLSALVIWGKSSSAGCAVRIHPFGHSVRGGGGVLPGGARRLHFQRFGAIAPDASEGAASRLLRVGAGRADQWMMPVVTGVPGLLEIGGCCTFISSTTPT
jgi:hypothetical protein